ncbi:hypothetical protein NX023_02815 [Cytobacillus firmus]|nr:hypothetical protein [Cytobacillus firmus]
MTAGYLARVVHVSRGKAPKTREKGTHMGMKDGKAEPNDIGSNMKITVSKKTQKEIQNNQNNNKKK